MKYLQKCVIIPFILVMVSQYLGAQHFAAGVQGGLSLSQLDGDQFTGYDKKGIWFGIRGQTNLSRYTEFMVELNYVQKGSRFGRTQKSEHKNRLIRLSYAEVPVIFRFHKKEKTALFYDLGFSVSFLIHEHFEFDRSPRMEESFEEIIPDFQRRELNGILGIGWSLSSRLGCFVRTSIGMSLLYKDETPSDSSQFFRTVLPHQADQPVDIRHLRNYHILLGTFYLI